MAKDKDTLQNALDNQTFDESLKRDSITSALGKDNVNISKQEISAPTFNDFEIPTIQKSTASEASKDYSDITLSEQEAAAQEQGANDAALGVYHSTEEDIAAFNRGEFNPTNIS